ncbi:hypothetical protein B0T26DRAFT_789687 [Lasiosphaeria miniovina]|uniref:Mitotic apparatus protein p62 n=1 Tax=Lasiosphaeria miniovina TaxID=1954250 RepID=A0AA39ZZP2_9PEZI|nr:uncharacterized protein B0T26DRAFT_789687 [Lasiosphaeria miniovina]KAK0706559.1 hypothetical protein B0T26DRAFT_789687 [Lasiosphaeria miniovina]
MAAFQIIRILRTDAADDEGVCVLGQVTPSGSKPLNVKLVVTEGEEPYAVKLKHDRIGDLLEGSSPCSPSEWEAILKSVLLDNSPLDGIEAGAEAHVGKSVTITIRRRIAGINQRLGTITLKHTPDEGIQLFDWCGAAALEQQKSRDAVAAETAKVADLEARVAELRSQLAELLEAKKARETEILEKVCGLLNEKKVKIREQQLLLSTARVDPSKLAEVRAAFAARPRAAGAAGQAPRASRASKRKALEDASGDDGPSDDGFERMDVDEGVDQDLKTEDAEAPEKWNDSDERQTTDDDATGSEPDDEDLPPPPATRRKAPDTAAKSAKGRPAAAAASQATKASETLTMQPRRAAATTTRSARATASPSPAPAAAAIAAEGSEIESDDEL